MHLNDKGEVDLDEGYVIGKAADVFGAKIYESTPALDTALQDLTDAPAPAKEEHLEPLKKSITKEIIAPMVEQAKQEYGHDLKLSDQKRFEIVLNTSVSCTTNTTAFTEINFFISQIYSFYLISCFFCTLCKLSAKSIRIAIFSAQSGLLPHAEFYR